MIVASEGDGFFRDTFLEAAVAVKGDDVVIEECVLCSVKFRGSAFPGEGESNCVCNTLAEGPVVASTPGVSLNSGWPGVVE